MRLLSPSFLLSAARQPGKPLVRLLLWPLGWPGLPRGHQEGPPCAVIMQKFHPLLSSGPVLFCIFVLLESAGEGRAGCQDLCLWSQPEPQWPRLGPPQPELKAVDPLVLELDVERVM